MPGMPWRADLQARFLALWPAKMAANTLGMAAFFIAYFWVMHHPQGAVTVMPQVALDAWIGFEPAAMPLYLSLWLYVSLPLALLRTRRELTACGLAAFSMSAAAMAIFLVWPTALPPAGIDWSLHPSIAFLKTIDVGDNACPSLHVAFAVFTLIWLGRLLAEMRSGAAVQLFNGAWCLGILYSTLATRQHVALDVLAGALLGVSVAVLHERVRQTPAADAASSDRRRRASHSATAGFKR